MDLFSHGFRGFAHPPDKLHGIRTGGNELQPFHKDGLCKHGRGSGPITGDIAGLGSSLFDQLHGHVLERITKLDLFRYGDTVFGDVGAAPALIKNSIAAFRAEGALDCLCQDGHTRLDGFECLGVVTKLLGHNSPPF